MDKKEDLVAIKETPRGPYIVTGEFKLTTKSGTETIVKGPIALCRCGHSRTKPFCDGTHIKIHFEE